jgi:DNA-binding NarL/FixJ family response regulator
MSMLREHDLPRAGNAPIRVLLVDDHPAVRLGVRRLLDDEADMLVLDDVSGTGQALARATLRPDVVVIDYHLGGRDGLWLTIRLTELEHPPRVLIYSAFADGLLSIAAIAAGADGLLNKGALGEELPIAIRRLAGGRNHLPAIDETLARALRSQLAPEDQAILGMLVHGTPVPQIEDTLNLTGRQLAARRAGILRTLLPRRPASGPHPGCGRPLDYDRARRRGRHRPA